MEYTTFKVEYDCIFVTFQNHASNEKLQLCMYKIFIIN